MRCQCIRSRLYTPGFRRRHDLGSPVVVPGLEGMSGHLASRRRCCKQLNADSVAHARQPFDALSFVAGEAVGSRRRMACHEPIRRAKACSGHARQPFDALSLAHGRPFDTDYQKTASHRKKRVEWLPRMDLNHDNVIQSHVCYRYTTRQRGDRRPREQFVTAKRGDVNYLTGSRPLFRVALRIRKLRRGPLRGERWYR